MNEFDMVKEIGKCVEFTELNEVEFDYVEDVYFNMYYNDDDDFGCTIIED